MERLSGQSRKMAILNFPVSKSDIPLGTRTIWPNSRFTRRSETESYLNDPCAWFLLEL